MNIKNQDSIIHIDTNEKQRVKRVEIEAEMKNIAWQPSRRRYV